MFRRDNDDNANNNFWISYADLMAGLLFVFILLIGAIISKSILMRQDLHKKEDRLIHTEQTLEEKRIKLNKTKQELTKLQSKLQQKEKSLLLKKLTVKKQQHLIADINTTLAQKRQTIATQKAKIKLQAEEVAKLHRLLADLQNDLKVQKTINQELNNTVVLTKSAIKLKEKELNRLNQLLLARNAKVDTLNGKIVILQNLLHESNTTIAQKQKKLQEYADKVVVLSNQLTDKEHELHMSDQKLADLLTALDDKKTRYDQLIAKLQRQKARIRSLTGIQIKVIAALKETLGDKINIDKKTGALRLSSSILFDKGSSILKDEAKTQLAKAFDDYIGALVSNEAIRPHLERIVIEGHTDSDGTYLYNIALSQKRALAVMNYLLTLPIAHKYNLQQYLVASGRAYLDPIMRNGQEDKEASRRIEIKFQLKNRDAMHEIERIIDEN